ncbi:MAG: RraA family protein [Pedosphaera sp.]|nr:RraA family protein [Pedosphaera sp.]
MKKQSTKPDQLRDFSRRLEKAYAGAVYDVLRALGLPNQTLPHDILPLHKDQVLAGPVFTVEGRPVAGLDPHESLLLWTAMLSKATPGHVVVCQPHDSTMAHMGELSSETFHLRGIRGYIVDGGCRDTDFIEKLGFKVFFRYTTPVDVVGRWRAEKFNKPIVIGGVKIHAGDFVFGDRDGVLIIPKAKVGDVVTNVEKVINTESKVRRAIVKEGMDPQEAYLKYGKF